jgi:hypothetical protein
VDAQVIGQQTVRGGLALQLVQVGHVPPGEQHPAGAHDPDDRPPGGQHQIGGYAYPVVGGGVPVPRGGELHVLAGCFPGAPVRGDDRLALRPAVRQIGVRRARGLNGAGLGACVGGAERDHLSVPVALRLIG